MLLSSLQENVENESCWLCGEKFKRKEKRVFIVNQLIISFTEAHFNSTDPRNALFTDCVTNAPSLYEWWSAFISVNGDVDKFKCLLDEADKLVHLTIGIVCQRSSSLCSNLYEGITQSTGIIDPVAVKLAAEEQEQQQNNQNIQTSSPNRPTQQQNNRTSTTRNANNNQQLPFVPVCSVEHWRRVVNQTRIMEGWMTKKSHDFFTFMRKWQRRYFVLDLNTKVLSYYLDEGKTQLRGQYALGSGMRVVQLSDGRLPRDRPHQIEIVGTSMRSRQFSTLLLSVDSIQLVNFWFACFRVAIRGEHFKILEMRNWQHAMKAIQAAYNESLHLLSSLSSTEPSITTSLPSFSKSFHGSISESFSMSFSSISRKTSANLHSQRSIIEALELEVQNKEPMLLMVLGRLSEENICVDIEFLSAQKPILQDVMQFFGLLRNSSLSDSYAKYTFPDKWLQLIMITTQLLNLVPASLRQIHMRDMRLSGPGHNRTIGEAEVPYIYNLESHDIVLT